MSYQAKIWCVCKTILSPPKIKFVITTDTREQCDEFFSKLQEIKTNEIFIKIGDLNFLQFLSIFH